MNILVFDIGGTNIKYGLCVNDVLGDVKEIPTEAKKGGRHILNTVINVIKSISEPFDAIGISTAGQVNCEKGYIIYANSNIPEYTGMKLREELEELFSVPVMVENDVNSAIMGEAVYGAGKGHGNFICLTYGTGIGGGIVIDGKIYRGTSFSAAEFGAIVTHSEEKLKGSDPFDGCYEKYASTTALVKKAMEYDPKLNNGREIFKAVSDPNVYGIIDNWTDEITLGLSSLIHIFNPSCVVLGGGIISEKLITDLINKKIGKMIMPSFKNVEIKTAELKNTAGLMGVNHLTKLYSENKNNL